MTERKEGVRLGAIYITSLLPVPRTGEQLIMLVMWSLIRGTVKF